MAVVIPVGLLNHNIQTIHRPWMRLLFGWLVVQKALQTCQSLCCKVNFA